MKRRLAQRLLFTIIVLAAATVAAFVLTLHIGDPVSTLAGPHATSVDRAHIRHFYGLDRPIATQLAIYVGHLLQLDLGMSYRYQQPVSALIAERLPRTLLLGVAALALQSILGVAAGTFAAARRGRAADRVTLGTSFALSSIPPFISGPLLLLGVAYVLGWFPIGGYGIGILGHLECLVLPAVTLGLFGAAYYARLARTSLVEVLDADFVRTARAKGAAPFRVLVGHALRNALLPLVTDLGMSVGVLLGGAVIVETVFAWPGMGKLAYDAVTSLDVPVIVGTVIVGTAGTLLGNIGSDIACAWLDPRLRE